MFAVALPRVVERPLLTELRVVRPGELGEVWRVAEVEIATLFGLRVVEADSIIRLDVFDNGERTVGGDFRRVETVLVRNHGEAAHRFKHVFDLVAIDFGDASDLLRRDAGLEAHEHLRLVNIMKSDQITLLNFLESRGRRRRPHDSLPLPATHLADEGRDDHDGDRQCQVSEKVLSVHCSPLKSLESGVKNKTIINLTLDSRLHTSDLNSIVRAVEIIETELIGVGTIFQLAPGSAQANAPARGNHHPAHLVFDGSAERHVGEIRAFN